jgi:Flp pilus assembly protein TadG
MTDKKNCSGIMTPLGLWTKCRTGSIALYMALLIPVLTATIGFAIDMSEAYMVRERLTRALDAAALAAAGSVGLSETQMQARVDAFMAANYPPGKIGGYYNVKLTKSGDFITVTGSAKLDTAFMRFLGSQFNTLTTQATTKVQLQVQGIEVALVLDNTGSMSYKPSGSTKTNIQALKDSSADFVNIMFSKAAKPEDIRVGLVPYANSVRVGLYGLGKIPDPLTGEATGTYDNGATFITLPAGKSIGDGTRKNSSNNFYAGMSGTTKTTATPPVYSFSTTTCSSSSNPSSAKCTDLNYSDRWYGCVIEHKTGGWDINSSNNDPYPNDVRDDYTGPWETYRYSTLGTGSTCIAWHCTSGTKTATGCSNPSKFVCDTYNPVINQTSNPNESCPYANVMPLSSNQAGLLSAINTMQANGNTQGNTGMIWGYRLISPEEPFTEGSDWGSLDWKKAIIMMTDGDNTWDPNYSEYWLSKRSTSMSEATLDSRFKEVCQSLKDKNVLVYTVVFKSQVDPTQATKDMYKNCATDTTKYFYAPTQAGLQTVFEQIAHELSNLHIAE